MAYRHLHQAVRPSLVALVIAILCGAAPAYAFETYELTTFSGSLSETMVASGDMWAVIPDGMGSNFVNGSVTGYDQYWTPSNADISDVDCELTWMGNPLISDISSGGKADGTFGGGGTFALTGTIDYTYNFMPAQFTGTLLTGTVGGFHMVESAAGSNYANNVSDDTELQVTGGWLSSSTAEAAGVYMPLGHYFTLSLTTAGLSDISSWHETIFTQSGQFNLIYSRVPEPSTALLLLLGSVGFLTRGRKR